jgi:hypothetical protein
MINVLKVVLGLLIATPFSYSFSKIESNCVGPQTSGASSGRGKTYSEAYSIAFSQMPSGVTVYNKGIIKGVNGNDWVVTLFWRSR